jgi:hypothetical protein
LRALGNWAGKVGWKIQYEHAGTQPPLPPEGGPEDLWRLTMFPVPLSEDEVGQVVPETRVDVLAVQEMLDDVDEVWLLGEGHARVWGRKKGALVEIDLFCYQPDDDEK